ncbi:MAG: hypothetical protein ACK559_34205 [bacterium]
MGRLVALPARRWPTALTDAKSVRSASVEPSGRSGGVEATRALTSRLCLRVDALSFVFLRFERDSERLDYGYPYKSRA